MKSANTLTPGNIKKWAYRKKAKDVPVYLWQLETFVKHGELMLSLISDKYCPQRALILNSLYFLVGQSVSTHTNSDINQINILLSKASFFQDEVILNWVNRSKVVLNDLRKYDYVEWCDGGFVRKDLA